LCADKPVPVLFVDEYSVQKHRQMQLRLENRQREGAPGEESQQDVQEEARGVVAVRVCLAIVDVAADGSVVHCGKLCSSANTSRVHLCHTHWKVRRKPFLPRIHIF
jgi:hypothetical protein